LHRLLIIPYILIINYKPKYSYNNEAEERSIKEGFDSFTPKARFYGSKEE